MWEVIEKGPIVIMKAVYWPRPARTIEGSEPQRDKDRKLEHYYVKKAQHDHLVNLDCVAHNNIIFAIIDGYISRVMKCKIAKEIWKTISLISQGTEKIKEDKLSVLMQELETLTMKPTENIE